MPDLRQANIRRVFEENQKGLPIDHGCILLTKAMTPTLPGEIVRRVCGYLPSIEDVVNYALVDKFHAQAINGTPDLWVEFLKQINVWGPVQPTLLEAKLTPINCLSFKMGDPEAARLRMLHIWHLLHPIVVELLIKDNANFQSIKTFETYNSPTTQAKLLTNVYRMLPLYKRFPEYKKMIIKLDTLMNMFISSLTGEIRVRLDAKDYSTAKILIGAIDNLHVTTSTIDPLESLIEFFYERYGSDYAFLLDGEEVNRFFTHATNKRGAVNGFELSYTGADDIFQRVSDTLNANLAEITAIFHSKTGEGSEVDEVPIVLKVLEHFLSNYFVGVLVDRIISRSKEIDAEDMGGEPSKGIIEDPRINIMNEDSLFFQCVPYLHERLISFINTLKYPHTEIQMDNGKVTEMDYAKVGCQLVNYTFENYLTEFTFGLPLRCKASLFQVIDSWQSHNANVQRGIEHEIMKNVEEDTDQSKFNFEMFSAFSTMFSFKKQKATEEEGAKMNKLSKVAARLQILSGKVVTLKSLVSMDLVVLLLQHIKNSYDLLLGLTKYPITDQLRNQINQTCINIFNDMLTILTSRHIRPGFNEALDRLKKYDPMLSEGVYINGDVTTLEPLKNFIELVDAGDLILQMVEIFYDKELIGTEIVHPKVGHSKDFLKMNVIEKSIKTLESSLDNYVATGLDVTIMIIMNEIQTKIENNVGPIPLPGVNKSKKKKDAKPGAIYGAQFPPPTSSQSTVSMSTTTTTLPPNNKVYDLGVHDTLPMNRGRPMEWVTIATGIMDTHFKLLQETIERGIMDAFKQEIGDRFVTLLIQLLVRKFVVSTTGAVQLSFDINYLHAFYAREKIKPAIEYLVGFKMVDQIYLVECQGERTRVAELGRMVVDVGRDNGVFTPEEVYQFATRRADWGAVKRGVDKTVYGLGLEDCVVM